MVLIGLGLNTVLMAVLVPFDQVPYAAWQALTTICVFGWNYAVSSAWVFGEARP